MHGVIKEKICLQLLPTILVKPLSVGEQYWLLEPQSKCKTLLTIQS